MGWTERTREIEPPKRVTSARSPFDAYALSCVQIAFPIQHLLLSNHPLPWLLETLIIRTPVNAHKVRRGLELYIRSQAFSVFSPGFPGPGLLRHCERRGSRGPA